MLLDMEQQQTAASFMSSLNISPFSMNLDHQPSSPVHGTTSSQSSNNNNSSSGSSGNSNNTAANNGGGSNSVSASSGGGGDPGNDDSDNVSPPDYAYAIGNTALHLSAASGGSNTVSSNNNNNNYNHNNNNNNNNSSHNHNHNNNSTSSSGGPHHHHGSQQHSHHQQQPQQLGYHPHNMSNQNFSYSYVYNFDSQYIFPTGYQDNTSSNSQQSGGGGSLSGGIGGSGGGNSSGNGGGPGTGSGGGAASGGYMSLIPPPVGTSGGLSSQCVGIGGVGGVGVGGGSGSGGDEQTAFKYLFEELCPVCGDKVSGYHYGLLTCESCKGFFKRTVQNKKVYTCVAERSCHIDKTQRKRCPFCRFQKCLEVGMKLEAVRADRMRGGRNKFGPMYKRDRARKLQMMRQRQLAMQAIRGSMSSTDLKQGQISPTGYQQTYPSMSMKPEIQIPQVSSLTQSPDSSPSPIAIALGQINTSSTHASSSLSGGSGSGPTNTTTVSGTSGDGGGGGVCGPGGEPGSTSTSLQHSADSKLWFVNSATASTHSLSSKNFSFDSGSNPTSTADSVSNVEPLRVSPMIREFVQSIDDREWQSQLFALLQRQSYNQVEVDLFELMCKVLDQNLFAQVDWARNTEFFNDLKVDDQMKLLQNSWSEMLVLDHLHHRIHNGLPDETPLNNGQVFNLLNLGLLGVPQLSDYFNELQNKLLELKFDMGDYVCMKFLLLLNPDVRGIINRKTVLEGYENVQAALLDYTLTCYPSVTDKFSRLLNILPEIHAMASRGEEHLYLKHCAGSAPTQTLLMEMLHAKRKQTLP